MGKGDSLPGMKLQLQHRAIRVRLDRAEFDTLIRGLTLRLDLLHAGEALLEFEVAVGPDLGMSRHDRGWRLQLPLADLETYAPTLPRRDGLHFDLGDGLGVDLEVDLRRKSGTF